jgi:hypothetical protein
MEFHAKTVCLPLQHVENYLSATFGHGKPENTALKTVVLLVNSSIGSGILNQPYVFKEAGRRPPPIPALSPQRPSLSHQDSTTTKSTRKGHSSASPSPDATPSSSPCRDWIRAAAVPLRRAHHVAGAVPASRRRPPHGRARLLGTRQRRIRVRVVLFVACMCVCVCVRACVGLSLACAAPVSCPRGGPGA